MKLGSVVLIQVNLLVPVFCCIARTFLQWFVLPPKSPVNDLFAVPVR